jgi:hypothetical protein
MSEEKKELTLGEKRVRTEFNPSKAGNVEFIKQTTAKVIDVLEELKKDERHQHNGETLRLISLAQTAFEDAAMWGVKAVTS